jgi:hypothetical protein
VPVTLLVWGVGRIVPVRITRYSIEEQTFLPSLRPLQATVSLTMSVLQPQAFKELSGFANTLASALSQFYAGQQRALAALNVAGVASEALRSLLPS